MMAWDVSLISCLTSVKWAHYIDDIMITYEDSPLLQKSLQSLLDHPQQKDRAVNLQRIQGPVTSIKFLGVM